MRPHRCPPWWAGLPDHPAHQPAKGAQDDIGHPGLSGHQVQQRRPRERQHSRGFEGLDGRRTGPAVDESQCPEDVGWLQRGEDHFVPVLRSEDDLDSALRQHEHGISGVALVEYVLALAVAAPMRASAESQKLGFIEIGEQRRPC